MIKDCDIYVQLDSDEPVYRPGDEISGTVRVEVGSECDNNGVPVALEWYTHGRGNVETQEVASTRLSTETWQPGQSYEYDFVFEAPAGPVTYRGNYVNVDWRVTASADIPWAFDPDAAAELLVEPGPAESYTPGEAGAHRDRIADSENGGCGNAMKFVFGLVFLGGGLIPLATALFGDLGARAIWPVLFSIPFLGVGGWVMYTAVRNRFAEARLGEVETEVNPKAVGRGGEVQGTVRFAPETNLELNHVRLALKGRERAISGSGTNKTTHTHPLLQSGEILPESQGAQLKAGEGVAYDATFELPDTAPFTFHGDDNHVEWQIEFHVDIPGWPDWLHTAPLLVRPSVGAETGKQSDQSARESDPEAYAVEW